MVPRCRLAIFAFAFLLLRCELPFVAACMHARLVFLMAQGTAMCCCSRPFARRVVLVSAVAVSGVHYKCVRVCVYVARVPGSLSLSLSLL